MKDIPVKIKKKIFWDKSSKTFKDADGLAVGSLRAGEIQQESGWHRLYHKSGGFVMSGGTIGEPAKTEAETTMKLELLFYKKWALEAFKASGMLDKADVVTIGKPDKYGNTPIEVTFKNKADCQFMLGV
jgi:hypothetical protein